MKRVPIHLVLILFVMTSAHALERTETLLARAWPAAPFANLDELGTGVGIVFSPDLSVPGNCRFYTALGFACFESADWLQILADIHQYNLEHPGARVRTLILETHGTNGNGLKVQAGKEPPADRSYVSVGALQEILEPVGLRYLVLSACNSGRLLRPEIFLKLDPNNGDKLFLPATRGIIDATDEYDAAHSRVTIITPASSHIETTLVGSMRELAPATRDALEAAAKAHDVKLPKQFAISEMLIQMLTRAPELQLQIASPVEALSADQTPADASERLFRSFVAHLDFVAARDGKAQQTASAGSR
ncbi:MAG: hypothetical protein JO197_19505 [Acidobacteria bacterium]|nr:hypothetical protein [Acidobacteriota bacterium]MBV9477005.1 hypothetical protein [Acidobacteriota bacterium]